MKHLLLLACCCFALSAAGQAILADKENRTSILNIPSGVGLDVSDQKISLDINNFVSQTVREKKWLFGVKYIGGNDNKESRLFDNGKYVFGSEIAGAIAYSWLRKSNEQKEAERRYHDLLASIGKQTTNDFDALVNEISTDFQAAVVKLKASGATDDQIEFVKSFYLQDIPTIDASNVTQLTFLNEKLDATRKELDGTTYRKTLAKLGLSVAQIDIVRDEFLVKVLDYYDKQNVEAKVLSLSRKQIIAAKTLVQIERLNGVDRCYVYLRGGINGRKFTTVGAVGDSAFFKPIEFQGNFVEVGFNVLRRGRRYFGISLMNEFTSSFADLKQSKYAISLVDSIGGKVYERKEEKTAYLGDYYTFHRQIVKIDYATRYPFLDKSTLVAGPYVRLVFQNDDQLDNQFTVGYGINFYKNSGKFIVGSFIEAPNLYSSGSLINTIEKCSFGFRASYVFSELIGM